MWIESDSESEPITFYVFYWIWFSTEFDLALGKGYL